MENKWSVAVEEAGTLKEVSRQWRAPVASEVIILEFQINPTAN